MIFGRWVGTLLETLTCTEVESGSGLKAALQPRRFRGGRAQGKFNPSILKQEAIAMTWDKFAPWEVRAIFGQEDDCRVVTSAHCSAQATRLGAIETLASPDRRAEHARARHQPRLHHHLK